MKANNPAFGLKCYSHISSYPTFADEKGRRGRLPDYFGGTNEFRDASRQTISHLPDQKTLTTTFSLSHPGTLALTQVKSMTGKHTNRTNEGHQNYSNGHMVLSWKV